ncbi:RNA polymerase subunit sigma-24 [Enterobacterales bacterium CwR94]|nr:RNA polymerase subunit sigma-24 [Enterobacterales bacterium CwR94]
MSTLSDEDINEVMPHLQRFALWLTRHSHSAEDLVQSTLLKGLTSKRPQQDTRSLRGWLFAIMYSTFIDGQRRHQRWQRIIGLFSREDECSDTPENIAMSDQTLQAFDSLSSEARALILLINIEGMRYQEAADALGIPVGTVMSRLSRARRQLSEKLTPHASPLRRVK